MYPTKCYYSGTSQKCRHRGVVAGAIPNPNCVFIETLSLVLSPSPKHFFIEALPPMALPLALPMVGQYDVHHKFDGLVRDQYLSIRKQFLDGKDRSDKFLTASIRAQKLTAKNAADSRSKNEFYGKVGPLQRQLNLLNDVFGHDKSLLEYVVPTTNDEVCVSCLATSPAQLKVIMGVVAVICNKCRSHVAE